MLSAEMSRSARINVASMTYTLDFLVKIHTIMLSAEMSPSARINVASMTYTLDFLVKIHTIHWHYDTKQSNKNVTFSIITVSIIQSIVCMFIFFVLFFDFQILFHSEKNSREGEVFIGFQLPLSPNCGISVGLVFNLTNFPSSQGPML